MYVQCTYTVGQKTGLFLRSDNFATTDDKRRVIGYVKSFKILPGMKCIICMSMQLNILFAQFLFEL